MAACISLDSLLNSLFNDIFCFQKKLFNLPYYARKFLVGALRFGISFPKLQTFPEIFWALPIYYSLHEKILGIFVYLFIYKVTTTKVNFRFYKQCSQAITQLFYERAIFA